MNIFKIQQQYVSIINQVIEAEGELSEELIQAIEINETDLKEKAVNYGYAIRMFEFDNTIVDEEIKRLQALKKLNNKKAEWLERTISNAMQQFGIEKVESPTLKLSFRKSESVEIVNEAQLTEQFTTTKTTVTPNKTAIKEAIKNGEVVEGAVLVTNFNLQIK
jgi:hypothetical protein